jgi:hypothetical protein
MTALTLSVAISFAAVLTLVFGGAMRSFFRSMTFRIGSRNMNASFPAVELIEAAGASLAIREQILARQFDLRQLKPLIAMQQVDQGWRRASAH